jgi:Fic family protein
MRIYSISNQIMRNRSSYYDALEQAQSGDLEITNWLIWFLNTFIESCKTSSRFIDDAIAKSQFWQRYANRGLSERHRKVIQKLIEAGDGGFLGGLTAEKYQKITKVSKATATRDLRILKEWGILFTNGEGKATRYYLRLGNWQHGLDKA